MTTHPDPVWRTPHQPTSTDDHGLRLYHALDVEQAPARAYSWAEDWTQLVPEVSDAAYALDIVRWAEWVATEATYLRTAAIREAREAGVPWQALASVLGLDLDTVQDRYGHLNQPKDET